jgi:hypothetical protein
MFRPFMEIFFISVQQIQQGVVPDGADKGVTTGVNITKKCQFLTGPIPNQTLLHPTTNTITNSNTV